MVQEFEGKRPELKGEFYIHEKSVLIGDIKADEYFSSWPGAVIRADVAPVIMGKRCCIQDNVVLHVSKEEPIIIGDDVCITHGAILHSCKIGNNCFVSMGAIILDGAIIEDDCLIAAGALVPPGKIISKGSVVMGTPGKVVRNVTEEEKRLIKETTYMYVDLIDKYKQTAKSL